MSGTCALVLQVLGANLETLAAVLEVPVDNVLELVIQQPTLLVSQVGPTVQDHSWQRQPKGKGPTSHV